MCTIAVLCLVWSPTANLIPPHRADDPIRSAIIFQCAGAINFRAGSRSSRNTLTACQGKKIGLRVTTSPHPACSSHPAESEGTSPGTVDDALGAHSLMGERPVRRCQHDQCAG